MIINYLEHKPQITESAFVASNATVIGKTSLGQDVNVWFGAVIRGDVNTISIGDRTNVQDNAVIHVADAFACTIGQDVTIGHSAIVHACTVGNNVLVGMGSTILDGAVIEDNVIIGAGALVPPGKKIPKNSLVVGSPCKIVRLLSEEEVKSLKYSAEKYVALSKHYKREE